MPPDPAPKITPTLFLSTGSRLRRADDQASLNATSPNWSHRERRRISFFEKWSSGIKTGNLCRNLCPIGGGIEDRNLLGPVSSLDKRIPELRDVVPDSTHDSKACNDDSLLHLIQLLNVQISDPVANRSERLDPTLLTKCLSIPYAPAFTKGKSFPISKPELKGVFIVRV